MDDMFGWFMPRKPVKQKKTGRQLRDKGSDLVMENEHAAWKSDYDNNFNRVGIGWIGTGEDFKIICLEHGMKHPHHASCWSAAWGAKIHEGRLEFTGSWRTSTLASRHA